jgi:hypothetical protein
MVLEFHVFSGNYDSEAEDQGQQGAAGSEDRSPAAFEDFLAIDSVATTERERRHRSRRKVLLPNHRVVSHFFIVAWVFPRLSPGLAVVSLVFAGLLLRVFGLLVATHGA